MNKKKIAGLLLVGTLLVGGGALGAKAWFTSSAPVKANLVINTGKLEVKAVSDSAWLALNQDTESITNVEDVMSNAQPGDHFYKVVKIENTGTLTERVNFEANTDIVEKYKGAISVDVGDQATGEHLQSVILAPGESKEIRMVVSLQPEMGNEYQATEINLSEVLNSDTLIKVNAYQINDTSGQAK